MVASGRIVGDATGPLIFELLNSEVPILRGPYSFHVPWLGRSGSTAFNFPTSVSYMPVSLAPQSSSPHFSISLYCVLYQIVAWHTLARHFSDTPPNNWLASCHYNHFLLLGFPEAVMKKSGIFAAPENQAGTDKERHYSAK